MDDKSLVTWLNTLTVVLAVALAASFATVIRASLTAVAH
jgi:hypothetical protein